ncbi:MAG TPA: VOC family protein [Burkholderiales bacterium]|nr:VOC family protein [Burkholderiales bacterium]
MPVEALINIDVPDLDAAVEFYQRAAGLKPGRRLFQGTVAELSGAAAPILLLLKEPGSSAVPSRSLPRGYWRHWTPVHLDLVVPDVDAATARAVAAGAVLEGEIRSYAWGRQACLSDPFGHGFCFLQWKGAGYDEVA